MKNQMDCAMMTERHPIAAHPRVWQPWYIGGEDLKRTSSAPVSPVDLRDSPSKELPTRSHKLRRSQQRRELTVKDRTVKRVGSPLDNVDHTSRQPMIGIRDESSASDMEQQLSGGDDDPLDDDLDDDGDDDQDVELDAEEEDAYDDERSRHLAPDEDDGPLDMTTGNRSRSRGASSPSPSPPLSLAPVVITPSFCSNRPLLYSPFASAAPPPPYHPMPPLHYHQHIRTSAAQRRHHSHSQRSPSPPPPPYFASAAIKSNGTALANGKSGGAATLLQQQHRPSVITCASALAGRHRVAPVANRRSLSDPTPAPARSNALPASLAKGRRGSDVRHGHRREVLSGMCDPVIDEHFRRSLGKDYPEFLAASSPSSTSSSSSTAAAAATTSMPTSSVATSSASISITGMSVDDHFAKALGDTWLLLQGKMAPSSTSCSPTSASPNSSGASSPAAAGSSKGPSPPSSPLQQQRTNGLVST